MADFVIGGQSHAYAFGLPGVAKDASAELVKISEDLDGVVGGWPRSEAYWDKLAEMGSGRRILLSWFGSDAVSRYIFEGKPPFDFYLNSHPDLPILKDRAIIPEMLIRSTYSVQGKALRDVLNKLKSKSKEVILICPPLPKGTSEAALDLMRRHEFFTDLMQSLGGSDQVSIIKEPVLKKLWLLLRDMQKEAALAGGATFWDYPLWSEDSSGFLKPEFWRNDFTHANRLYASGIFKEISHARDSLPRSS